MFKWFFIILSSFWMSNTNGQTLDHSLTKEVDYKTNMDSLFSKIEFLSDSIKETLNEEDSISLVRNAYDTLNYDTLKYYSVRSEEHTSELQSRPHLVCRLLLEKKKKKKKKIMTIISINKI